MHLSGNCTLPLGKEIMKINVRLTESQLSSGQDTQCDILFSKNSVIRHREIKASLFCLSLGWCCDQKAIKKEMQNQSKVADQCYSSGTLSSKPHVPHFHGTTPLSEA